MIGDDVLLTGGSAFTRVPSGTSLISFTDYTTGNLQYAFSGIWQELPINSGSVFVDGSNN